MTSQLLIIFIALTSLQVLLVRSNSILESSSLIDNIQINNSSRPIRVSSYKVKDATGPEFNILIYRKNKGKILNQSNYNKTNEVFDLRIHKRWIGNFSAGNSSKKWFDNLKTPN